MVLGGVYIKRSEESKQIIPVLRAIVREDYREIKSDGRVISLHNDIGEEFEFTRHNTINCQSR